MDSKVAERIEADALGWRAVASGPADLLVVVLYVPRGAEVYDGPDVGLVDAHAERDRGGQHFDLVLDEESLDFRARLQGLARVIRKAADAVGCGN